MPPPFFRASVPFSVDSPPTLHVVNPLNDIGEASGPNPDLWHNTHLLDTLRSERFKTTDLEENARRWAKEQATDLTPKDNSSVPQTLRHGEVTQAWGFTYHSSASITYTEGLATRCRWRDYDGVPQVGKVSHIGFTPDGAMTYLVHQMSTTTRYDFTFAFDA